MYIDHQKSQTEALDQLAADESISGKEALEKITERVQSCLDKGKEKIRREKEDRSAEIDRQALMNTIEQRAQEESADFGKILRIFI